MQDDGTDRQAWETLFVTSVAIFLASMDVTIVSVALPSIARSFPTTPAGTLAWLFTSYNITFAALLLLGGRISDRIGAKTAFLGGSGLFALASLFAALAPSTRILMAARVLQAAGSAAIYPSSLTLLLMAFPVSRRSTALGIWGGVAGLGGVVAPTVGALLVEWSGWRAVFLLKIPFVLVAAGRGITVLRQGSRSSERQPFDPAAVPLAAVGIGALVLGIVQIDSWGASDKRTLASFAAAVILVAWFVRRSAHHPAPLLDLRLFHNRSFTVGNAVQVLATGPMFGRLVLMPLFFQTVWGWTPFRAGLAVVPTALVGAALSPPAGRLADRIGHRALVTIGLCAGALGPLWWMIFASHEPHYLTGLLPGFILTGIGAAAGVSTTTAAIMSQVPTEHYSMAGAARTTIFQLGLAIGIAVAASIVNAGDPSSPDPYRTVWLVSAVCSLAAAALMAAAFPGRPSALADEPVRPAAMTVQPTPIEERRTTT